MKNIKLFGLAFVSLILFFMLGVQGVSAFTLSTDDASAQETFKTINASFDLPNENVNALSVRLKATRSIIENVEIVDENNYLILPECDNGEIFSSDEVCFSIASEESFENGIIFLIIDLEIIDTETAKLAKVEGNAYSDGQEEFADMGELSIVDEEETNIAQEEQQKDEGYATQVYLAASVLIILVFMFCVVFILNDKYSFNLKMIISFFGLILMVFALYGAYSTYSKEGDVSVAGGLSNWACYDVIDKVCGTDGKTYRNECIAEGFGVGVACDGECPCDGEIVTGVAVCGNGVCEAGEDTFRNATGYLHIGAGCAQDCIVCGDGICDFGEADTNNCVSGEIQEGAKICVVEGTCPNDCEPVEQATSAVCGVLDVNEDNRLTIIDFAAFVKVYQKKCTIPDTAPGAKETLCGFQDVNGDGRINLIDFSNFVKRYNKAGCEL